jgi:hypothetical protein
VAHEGRDQRIPPVGALDRRRFAVVEVGHRAAVGEVHAPTEHDAMNTLLAIVAALVTVLGFTLLLCRGMARNLSEPVATTPPRRLASIPRHRKAG